MIVRIPRVPSVFSRIIAGELPGHFVWKDGDCVAFLSNRPVRPGHTLVVPRLEVDRWLDLEPELLSHLMLVAQKLGTAIQHGFGAVRVGLTIAGHEVPHAHIHLVPIHSLGALDYTRVDPGPRAADLEMAAETIRASLRALGISEPGGV